MFWRVSTYAQPTPVEALLDKGSPDLEELLQLDELLQVTGRLHCRRHPRGVCAHCAKPSCTKCKAGDSECCCLLCAHRFTQDSHMPLSTYGARARGSVLL